MGVGDLIGHLLTREPQRIHLKKRSDGILDGMSRRLHILDKYPAKMIPQMARFLIERVSEPGDTVLDPFCGTGTVVREAIALSRNAVGLDVNPLATLLTRVKVGHYSRNTLERQLSELLESFKSETATFDLTFPNAEYWFTPATLRKLGTIRSVVDRLPQELPSPYPDFWRAVLASIVRQSSRADTRGPKPFISKRARETRKGRHFDPFRLFARAAHTRIELLTGGDGNPDDCHAEVLDGNATAPPSSIQSSPVDAVVTSPPYLNAQDYYRSCKLELWVVGLIDPDALRKWARDELIGSDRIPIDRRLFDLPIGSPTGVDLRERLLSVNPKSACVLTKYTLDMEAVLSQITQILKPGGNCAIVSGDNTLSNLPVPTHQIITELALHLGFQLQHHYVDTIRDRWVPPSRNGHSGVILDDHIQIFQAP